MEKTQISLSGSIWRFKNADSRAVELMAQKCDLPPVVAELLVLRGISAEDADNFINPKIQNLLPDPSVLRDMDKAAQKIADCVINQEKIGIIGDYDVDGATSSALLGLFLEELGVKTLTHIPERDEGYGPSEQAFTEFAANDIKNVITVDCGTSAFEVLDKAAQNGFDIIIVDHHEAEAKLPNVYAIVNPKRLDETNEYHYLKYLAAVGVVFMTIVAVNRELRKRNFYAERKEPQLMNWLDLVALGTVCDVVPLLGLNRAFVKQGLKVMAKRENVGIKNLIDKSGITNLPTAYNLGYALGPRINACGRVGRADLGHKLLKAKDEATALALVDQMNAFNEERKQIETYVYMQAIEMLEGSAQEYPMAFVYGHDWHQGVIGIVAGKLKERYNLPAFVMSIEDDEVKGSARSIDGVDLGSLIIAAKERGIITKGGGHVMAAGFSLEENHIEDFRKFVGEMIKDKIEENNVLSTLDIDAILNLSAINYDLAEKVSILEPFGAANEEPIFAIKNVMISAPSIIGSGHIKCFLKSESGKSIKAIAFRAADTQLGKTLLESNGKFFDFAGNLHIDNWQNKNLVQFIIKDAREIK